MTTELVELADRLEAESGRLTNWSSNPNDPNLQPMHDHQTKALLTEAANELRAIASRAGGWTSVKDRLPGVCDHVEVYPDPRDETYCFYAHHDGGMNGVKAGRWYFNDRDGYDNEIKVTYWRYETAAPEPVAVGSNNSTNDEESV